jgi:polar amino acid transport system substrate-binding protein
MKQVVQYPKKGMLRIEDVPVPAIREGGIVVRNVASVVSAGTERAMIELAEKNIVSKARSRPDLVRQVVSKVKSEGLLSTYKKVKARLESPIPLGYSCAGVIEEVSEELNDFAVGGRVACAGHGYASHAEMIFVPKNLAVTLPQGVSFRDGAFVTLGAIALQGIRQANTHLGETVAVFGLGLLGQLTIQMLTASGCKVIAYDIDPWKINLAVDHGVDMAINNSSSSFERDTKHFTGGVGVDTVIITAATPSSELISQAAQIARDRGHITVVGTVGMNLERKPFYDKELSLNLSRSYGPGRYDRQYEETGQDYPIGYVRWTERRNMRAFLDLVAGGKVCLNKLVTHTFPSDEVENAYSVVTGKTPKPHLGIILEYPVNIKQERTVTVGRKSSTTIPKADNLVIGALGGGAYAAGVIFPAVKGNKRYDLKWLATPNGIKTLSMARQYGFRKATTSYDEMLADSLVGAVLLLTPHHLHAKQIVQGLEAGKWVFVEKPLATSEEELETVINTMKLNSAQLMVGFNRRYSPAITSVKSKLDGILSPSLFNYRISAGFIPKESPLQDDKIGKGRIIGEVCHFIDVMTFLAGASPTEVFAYCTDNGGGYYLNSDNLQISLKFADGSRGNITYAANGGKSLPKERLEVFSGGVSFVVDDFRLAEMFTDNRKIKLHSGAQDKGHRNELDVFAQRYLADDDLSDEFESSVSVTRATFAILESLSSGKPIRIE